MSWNYRVVRRIGPNERECFAIHEAYYREGTVYSISEEPTCLKAETIDQLKADLECIKEGLDKPVLDFYNFKN